MAPTYVWLIRVLVSLTGAFMVASGHPAVFEAGLILCIFGLTSSDFLPKKWLVESDSAAIGLRSGVFFIWSFRWWPAIVNGSAALSDYLFVGGLTLLSTLLLILAVLAHKRPRTGDSVEAPAQ
jgi:hypothetical protein